MRYVHFFYPIILSAVPILSIHLLESLSLHFVPQIAPLVLYFTATLLVLWAFYCTPWLVFKSIELESHCLKSIKEKIYMRRLTIT